MTSMNSDMSQALAAEYIRGKSLVHPAVGTYWRRSAMYTEAFLGTTCQFPGLAVMYKLFELHDL